MQKYFPQLDGLRFLAISMVLISHWSAVNFFRDHPIGFLGVTLFFVLSGFLITEILISAKENGGGFISLAKRFYWNRFLRIFPIYYLTLLAIYIFAPSQRNSLPWLLTYTTNFYFIHIGGYDGFSDHLWTLAVEEQFYLFWPFFVYFIPKTYLPKTFAALVLLAIGCRIFFIATESPLHRVFFTGTCVDSFACGGFLAFYYHYYKESLSKLLSRNLLWLALFLLLCVLSTTNAYFYDLSLFDKIFQRTLHSAFLFYLVGRAIENRNDILGQILSAGILRSIGKISYGIYLYHYFMLPVFASTGWQQHPIFENVRPHIVLLLGTLFCATLSWNLLEKPLMRWKRSA